MHRSCMRRHRDASARGRLLRACFPAGAGYLSDTSFVRSACVIRACIVKNEPFTIRVGGFRAEIAPIAGFVAVMQVSGMTAPMRSGRGSGGAWRKPLRIGKTWKLPRQANRRTRLAKNETCRDQLASCLPKLSSLLTNPVLLLDRPREEVLLSRELASAL